MQVVVGRDLGDGAEGRLATFPEGGSFRLGCGEAHRCRIVGSADVSHSVSVAFDTTVEAFDLGQEHGGCIGRVASRCVVLHRCRHALIHDFEGGRDDTGSDDIAHGLGGVSDRREREQESANGWWIWGEPNGDLGRNAKCAFTSDERAKWVKPGRLVLESTELSHLTVGEDDLDRKDVGVGDSVRQTVRSPGVVGDIAAERADLLA